MSWSDGPVSVYCGDVREVLAQLPEESVQCVVTSPPYWGLRDYGVEGQLGLEATPEEYVANMVAVFREVWRVLRKDGTLWLNVGDSYAGSWGAQSREDGEVAGLSTTQIAAARKATRTGSIPPGSGLKPKDLVGIPWRVALALQADGWWLRADVIWAKPNAMPSSVTDRPTSAHEYLFLLARSSRYFYDGEAIKEPSVSDHPSGNGYARPEQLSRGGRGQGDGWTLEDGAAGRNARSVWTIATQAYPDAHFATYPEALVIPCIKAGTSEHGGCPECGAPWERQMERKFYGSKAGDGNPMVEGFQRNRMGGQKFYDTEYVAPRTTGWVPTCAHDHDPIPCTVLDPFAGSGTTLAVARRLGRRSVGIELNPNYLPLIQHRVAGSALPLLETPNGSVVSTETDQASAGQPDYVSRAVLHGTRPTDTP